MVSNRPNQSRTTLFSHLKVSFVSSLWIIGVLLAGCATLDERMAGYVGQHRSEVISNWGPPAEETKLKDGGSRLVYKEDVPLIHPSQYVDPSLRICEKVFITDSRGIIKSYSHDNCE